MNLTFFITGLLLSCAQNGTTSIEEADRIYFQMKPDKAYAMYEEIWSGASFSKKDRAAAARKLATMSWLIYNDADKAFQVLEDLEGFGYEKSECYAVWSRILAEEDQHDKAIEMANNAMEEAESMSQTYGARMRYTNSVLEKYMDQSFNGSFDKNASNDDLQKAKDIIGSIMTNSPGDIDASKLHLGINLLAEDLPQAYKGWLSFYRADPVGNVHETLQKSQELLKVGFLTDDPNASVITAMINGLTESGFIEYAALMLKLNKDQLSLTGSELDDLWNYYQMLQNLEEITVAFYRAEAEGTANKNNYDREIGVEAQKLWNELSWEGDVPEYELKKFTAELRKRFGTVARLMTANGHYGLSLGHVVLDETREVSQYDKQGTLRYIAIDHMLSNGYSSWFWDGSAEIGGWAPDGSSILQVRSAYSSGPIGAWMMISDPVEMKEMEENIQKNLKTDDQIAKQDPYAYLPGLSMRVRYDLGMKLLSDLKSQELEGSELRSAFISTVEKLILESSIFAHEGRHAIDKKYSGRLNSEEMEYRAKLSEIYFSDAPLGALSAVLSPNIGDGTSHGEANKRVLKGIVGWMRDNKNEIAGLEKNRPLLPQLDKLTEDQLRTAVNSLDPLAK